MIFFSMNFPHKCLKLCKLFSKFILIITKHSPRKNFITIVVFVCLIYLNNIEVIRIAKIKDTNLKKSVVLSILFHSLEFKDFLGL